MTRNPSISVWIFHWPPRLIMVIWLANGSRPVTWHRCRNTARSGLGGISLNSWPSAAACFGVQKSWPARIASAADGSVVMVAFSFCMCVCLQLRAWHAYVHPPVFSGPEATYSQCPCSGQVGQSVGCPWSFWHDGHRSAASSARVTSNSGQATRRGGGVSAPRRHLAGRSRPRPDSGKGHHGSTVRSEEHTSEL